MDGTFGNKWDGRQYTKFNDYTFNGQEKDNRVFHLIYAYDKEELKNRWNFLRSSCLETAEITNQILNWGIKVPKSVFDYEAKRWPSRPGTRTNNIEQILYWINQRLNTLDDEIDNL